MTPFRLAPIAALIGSPALAHVNDTVHVHETDAIPVAIGLALIALAAVVAVRVRAK